MTALQIAKSLGVEVAEVDADRGVWSWGHALIGDDEVEHPSAELAARAGVAALTEHLAREVDCVLVKRDVARQAVLVAALPQFEMSHQRILVETEIGKALAC